MRIEEEWVNHRSGGWEMWELKMMGLTDSPYHACQAVTWAKCISTGDRLDPNNPFAWNKVVLKLPGADDYDCHRPWMFKQMVDGLLAADLLIYVEDGWQIGPTEDLYW